MSESNEEWVKKKAKEDMEKKLEGKTTTPQGTEISVEVDKDEIKRMVKEEMGDEGKESRELLEDIKLKASLLYEKKFGEFIEPTKLSLDEAKRIIKMASKASEPPEPSGNAPLSGQYSDKKNDLMHRKFDSYEEMISTLRGIERDKEHPQNADASLILDELIKRHWALRKQAQIPESSPEMPPISELVKKKKPNPVNPKNREEYK